MSKRHHRSGRTARRRARRSWLKIGLIAVLVLVGAAGAYVLIRSMDTLPLEISASKAHALYQNGAAFIDVRTQAEWDQAHIAGSSLIPLDVLSNRLDEVPRDRDIVVVCALGGRSKDGATILRQAGFTRVTCLAGGLQAWSAAGYPVEK